MSAEFRVWGSSPRQQRRSCLLRLLTALVTMPALLAGCSGSEPASAPASAGGEGGGGRRVRVTATVGMVADTARRVGGEHVEVTALMGPGVDPHLYKASEGDIRKLSEAELILYNGLNLEGKMGDIFRKLQQGGKPTVAVAEDGVEKSALRTPAQFQGHPDPHIWFDVSLWARTIAPVEAALSRLLPAHASEFKESANQYREELEQLHAECKAKLTTVPRQQRVLVTAHDAFGYFGRAYDVEVVGLQGISTSSEYGLRDIQRLVEMLATRQIKAVFVESSVPRRSIEAVVEGCKARGHTVVIGGTLFSDAMGEPGTPEGTYPGMVRHNVEAIVGALK